MIERVEKWTSWAGTSHWPIRQIPALKEHLYTKA